MFSNVKDVSSSELGTFLPQVSTDVMKAAAVSQLQDHLAESVNVSIDQPLELSSGSATLTLHNANNVVPVQVTDLAITSEPNPAVTVTGVPGSLDIPAGGTVKADVQLSASAQLRGIVSLQVMGKVGSPWQHVITNDLGLTWKADVKPSRLSLTVSPNATAEAGAVMDSPLVRVGGIGVVVMVLIGGAWGGWLATRPRMTGTLSLLRNGAVVDERLLSGRKSSLNLGDGLASIGLLPAKGADGQMGVSVRASSGVERATGTLFEGDVLSVGELTITYTTDRTRMLQLIGTD
ncbi:hypothetical protein [Raineyella fluvialis]|uniref:Uncharacterized protein n=1 Tax=Raineyella fluvialis TaxID=2662261 RepID=A0A5Q2FD35_9ACTN|nr:hypothetical protein [Raineyella fluvialis]QGF24291.1 hypothetical protein Rai3103_12170 [Raineyella fluvialis]